ncbi:MAG: hypothetical protein ACMUHX_07420 [bacterium]
MAHIFFERLEKRRSTQSLVPAFWGNNSIQPVYGVQIAPDTNTQQFFPEYGISLPNSPTTYFTGGYFPWGGGLFGMSGYSSPYNPFSSWTTPSYSYSPWNSWGQGSFFSPIRDFFGGLFGGQFPWSWQNNYPGFPDNRLLYGISPQPLYGISVPTTTIPDIVTYYGVSIPNTGILY